ncbi:CBS domain-containing protein [Amycolatopsis azurea]|uniref:CBS domain-containing protein n=1 Tax=Amycolatopsis azurea TaxID=36819 RepID=UPI00380F25EA
MSQLVPDDQDVLTISVGTRVEGALELMRVHNVDQLPVVTAENRVVGAFTHRSLARGMRHIRPQDNPLTAPVEDLVEELRFVRASQELGDILCFLDADNAVLVGDEDRLLAIVTNADLTRFLWHRTRPFVLLQDIELGIRDLMRSSCTDEELAGAVSAAIPVDLSRHTARLEDLTLRELLSVLVNGLSFGRFFRLRFGANRELVRLTLEPICEIRNKVFHFREEISSRELQNLMEVASWLRRKILIRDGER